MCEIHWLPQACFAVAVMATCSGSGDSSATQNLFHLVWASLMVGPSITGQLHTAHNSAAQCYHQLIGRLWLTWLCTLALHARVDHTMQTVYQLPLLAIMSPSSDHVTNMCIPCDQHVIM